MMKALLYSVLYIMTILEVCSQQPPELLHVNPAELRISEVCNTADIKVFRGDLTDGASIKSKSSIIGKLIKQESYSSFTPLVPFDLETQYTMACDDHLVRFKVAKPMGHEVLEVLSVYPATTQVPANILKWYVRFSKPVNPIKIYNHIRFLDEHGDPIDRSILDLAAPLLSDDGTLLTIWVEPGRQKQLLGPNHRLGSVFESDHEYTLVIDDSLKDADGIALANEVRQNFSTTAADRIQPSIDHWTVMSIQALTKQPVLIKCTEQLDYGSLIDTFSISIDGSRVAGILDYDSAESTISFTPEHNWDAGTYTIQLEPLLEDLAGNNLQHLFDLPIDQGEPVNESQDFTISVESR